MSDEGTVGTNETAAPETSTEATGTVQAATTESAPAWDPKADTDFLQKLEKFDPAALPESVRRRVELPFNQDYTRKMQQLAEDKNRFMEFMARRMGQQGQGATKDAFAELRERLQNGDYSDMDRFLERAVNEKVAPLAEQVARDRAFAEAQKMHPLVTERETDIARVLQENPRLAQLAYAGGTWENLPTILHGIALKIENEELKARTSPAAIEAQVKAKVAEALAKANGVPASTSKVGQASATRGKSFDNMRDAMEDAWSQALAARKAG